MEGAKRGKKSAGGHDGDAAARLRRIGVWGGFLRADFAPPVRLQRSSHDPNYASVEGAFGSFDVGVHGNLDTGNQAQVRPLPNPPISPWGV